MGMNNDNDVIEILDDFNEDNSATPGVDTNAQFDNTPITNNPVEQPKVEAVTEDNQKEITIESESKSEKSKSGLTFVIVIFILLIAFIIALPYISKLIP